MKYRFEQFKTDIDNPTVAVSSVTDNMNSTCSVGVTLTTPDVKMYGVTFDGFTYDVTSVSYTHLTLPTILLV